jgi:tetratricopeptide (TPR) repeat protein
MDGGGQLSRLSAPLPFRAWLNQTWIDLVRPFGPETLTPWGIEFAYQSFISGDDLPRFNSIYPTKFRYQIADAARACDTTVAVVTPLEVPPVQRSERWHQLCDAVTNYERLPLEQRERLVWLLHRLCFHQLVVDLTEHLPSIGAPHLLASLKVIRAIARDCLARRRGQRISGALFKAIWPDMQQGSAAAAEVSYHLLLEHAKHRPNAELAAQAGFVHQAMVEQAASRLSSFRAGLLWSRFYRVRAFVPMLAGDPDGMVADMDEAERIARTLTPANEAERFAAAEILWPVLESRVREAQFLHDLPLAESRAEQLIAAAPMNPRAWLHFGEVLLEQERYEDAIPVYREAHRLGPPASEVALFNLGQCHEMLDQAEPAMDAYAELLEIDPLAISAAERISSIAAEFGGRYQIWADAILGSLQTIETSRAA